jgi:3-phenylpropionate/trans-cinnamate dioxygenase ferredoxin component
VVQTESFTRVAKLTDIPDPGLLGVALPNGDRICLIRNKGVVSAVVDECTHQAFPMSAGEVMGDGTIQCTWHGARFDCVTGAVCEGPAYDPLATYEVRVEGDDVLVGGKHS